jgi:DNA-binding transcriptional ArsR family regulator
MQDEGPTEGGQRLEEAFELLGDPTRLDLIRVLATARGEGSLSYAELMDAVGAEDSGRFNYHLDRLVGSYVRKTEGGYVPTASATALYRTMLAYRPTADPERTTFGRAGTCQECGGELTARGHNGYLNVVCRDCETTAFGYVLPTGAMADRSDTAVLRAVETVFLAHLDVIAAGICPFCWSSVTTRLEVDHGTDPPPAWVVCDTCEFGVTSDPGPLLERSPEVRAVDAAGHDPSAEWLWERPPWTATVRGRNPVRVVFRPPAEDSPRVVVDGQLHVLDVER